MPIIAGKIGTIKNKIQITEDFNFAFSALIQDFNILDILPFEYNFSGESSQKKQNECDK